jgi:hypothetical protein
MWPKLRIQCRHAISELAECAYFDTEWRRLSDMTFGGAFPRKKLQSEKRSKPGFTQTSLFDSELASKGEVDFVMW